MSEYIETRNGNLVYEIEIDPDFEKKSEPEPSSTPNFYRDLIERIVDRKTQKLQKKVNELDQKLKMLLGEN